MKATDVGDPDYYHRVVNCQWACPVHTDVPQFIRLIGQGRYDDAYMLNRQSNVFPGILGRTCDRLCEPVCRRERVDGSPVAVCRLKRVTADLRGDISDRLPRAPKEKNGRRIAAIGCGPASLTVANDLLPLGYEVTIFERAEKPGGLMRSSIPAFRLPEPVLDEEIGYIVDMGADVRYGSPITSLASLLGSYDAVFIGSGSPRGKDIDLPGRYEGDADEHIHIGLDWLASIAFGHVEKIGSRVLVIGAGNTAMDCCRSARRLGGREVTVVARRPRAFFKASAWELEDAEEEGIEILTNLAPLRFVVENGHLVGIEVDRLKWDVQAQESSSLGTAFLPADDIIMALGQENAFPWIERDLGVEFNAREMPVVDPVTMASGRPGVFFGGDAAWGPKNIVWAVAHGHEAAMSIDNYCRGVPLETRTPRQARLISQKMGLSEWCYENDYSPTRRQKVDHVELARRFEELNLEVELGFSAEQTAREIQRCLNCDIETQFDPPRCIECDACIDICPVSCLTITSDGEEDDVLSRLTVPALDPSGEFYVSTPLPQTGRVMVKDENICLHCGLCAERCPTTGWDMAKLELNLPTVAANIVRRSMPSTTSDQQLARERQ